MWYFYILYSIFYILYIIFIIISTIIIITLGRCKAIKYCSVKCQRDHWKTHKNLCTDCNVEDSNEKLKIEADNHCKQHNFLKARKLYKKLLTNLVESGQEIDTTTLRHLRELARIYTKEGDKEVREAIIVYSECLDKFTCVFGEGHYETLSVMAELANVHKQYPEAQALFEECLSKQQIELGLWHPDCLSTMISLAGIYNNYIFYSKITYNNHLGTMQKQEKYAAAEALYNECLEKKVSCLGKNHPDCLSLMSDVSKTIYSQARYGESEILYKEILKKRKSVLGKWHILIQGTLLDLSHAIDKQEGREAESEAIDKQIMNFNWEGMAWQDSNGYPIH